jgi:class 3 adenylate cyclase/Flp pilus assembly protein TadD
MQADLSAYIPQDRRAALSQGVDLPDRASGAAMFADVSGFTPLAEALVSALGPRRGAEELTALLNQVYSALIEQVERFGGSVISFSGDAITCWFEDGSWGMGDGSWGNERFSPSPISQPPAPAALRAAACALAMREAMGAFAAIPAPGGPAALSVKVAVAAGPVRRFLLGDPQTQLLDVLAGPTLDRLSAIAQLVERDDVGVDPPTLDLVAGGVRVRGRRTGGRRAARVVLLGGLAAPVAYSPWPALAGELGERQARAWLPPVIYERMRAGAAPFLAELRPATALMLQFGGLDYDANDAGERLDRYIRAVQQVIARYEGTLIDITMADKGGYLYAAFGAPVAHEDDATRALRAALELRDMPVMAAGDAPRIGISQGTMRTGPYGGASRRAYGVLGDEVNLACRLMSAAAAGQILVSGRLRRVLTAGFFWSALPAMQVRGKRAPVELYRLLGAAEAQPGALRQAAPAAGVVGRAAERAALDELGAALLAGHGGAAVIEGEPGIGKSRLLADLVERLRQRGAASLAGAGQSVEQQAPYRAWRDVFRSYFELDDSADPDAQRGAVVARARAAIPAQIERLPLLNDVLGLGLPDTPLTAGLAGAARSDALGDLLVALLRARAAAQPLVLAIEDAHWLASRSWALAARVARAVAAERLPLLLLLATRRLEPDHPGAPHLRALVEANARLVQLGQLGPSDIAALAADRLGLSPDELPAALGELLHERALGNPFFAEELVATLRERGLIRIEAADADPLARPRCVVASDLRRAGALLPDTLQGLLLARIDRLTPAQQLTLKVASVIGTTFAVEPLQFARGRETAASGDQIKDQLRALAAQDYTWLEDPEPNLAYRFKHVLTRDAAYETLLFAQRRALHRSVAEWYEQTFGAAGPALAPHYPLLAHHYGRAEAPERERHYAWLAGIQAAEQYANAEAVAFFTRALELTPPGDLAARYAALFEREAAEELLAAREAQARDLAELAALADALGDDRRRAEVARSRARLAERVGDIAEMRALAQQAVALAEAAGAADVAIDAYDQLAWACMRAGTYAEARAHAEAGLRLARAGTNRRDEAQLLTALGCACAESGDLAMARVCLEQSAQIFRALGRQRGESVALGNLGEVVALDGDFAAARGYFERALQLYRMTGDRRNEGWILGNLGQSAMHLGDYPAARALHEQAAAIARATGDRNTEALALIDLGLVAHQLGDHATAHSHAVEALALATVAFTRIRGLLVAGHTLYGLGRLPEAAASYAEAQERARAADLRGKVAEAAAGLARVALTSGDGAGALAAIGGLLEQIERATFSGADEPLRVFLTCHQALRAAGDSRADAVASAARALLCERAAKLPDDAARERFLRQVPYHRAILGDL